MVPSPPPIGPWRPTLLLSVPLNSIHQGASCPWNGKYRPRRVYPSPGPGHSRRFPSGAVVKMAAMTEVVPTVVPTPSSRPRCTLRCGIVGSCDMSVFNFSRTCLRQRYHLTPPSTQQCTRVSFVLPNTRYCLVVLFCVSCFSFSVVDILTDEKQHLTDFDLRLCNDEWYWVSLHVLHQFFFEC